MDNVIKSLILYFCILLSFVVLFPRKINLINVDLGRHIKNGEVLYKTGSIVDTNYYSYTEQNNKVVNHHWLAGSIFYAIYSIGGFELLNICFALLIGLVLTICFIYIKPMLSAVNAYSLVFFLTPFILPRLEIRPEAFSYLFFVITLFLLEKHKVSKLSPKMLVILIAAIQLFWVNLHIFFILGPFIISAYSIYYLLSKDFGKAKFLLLVLIVMLVASLINPWGLAGLLEPFTIFKGYDLAVIENMPIFYLLSSNLPTTSINQYLTFFFTVVAFGVFSPILFKRYFNNRSNYIWFALFLIFSLFSMRVMRFTSIFGLYTIYYFAHIISEYPMLLFNTKNILRYVLPVLYFFLLIYTFSYKDYGIGLAAGVQESANFFKSNNLSGPILNDFVTGGYLIFNLFPDELVYIDGRPEAYSSDFKRSYVTGIFTNENIWHEQEAIYNFKTIFLSNRPTSLEQKDFINRRLSSNDWYLAYSDSYGVILTRQ